MFAWITTVILMFLWISSYLISEKVETIIYEICDRDRVRPTSDLHLVTHTPIDTPTQTKLFMCGYAEFLF